MPENVLAADVGGTNVRVSVVAPDGKILMRVESGTPSKGTAEEICGLISDLANKLLDQGSFSDPVRRFALAIPAIIDYSTGSVVRSPNLPHLDGFELARRVSEQTGVDVILENDATAATIGEQWLGAAKGVANVICATLGTGVGGGLIVNGQVLHGVDGTAGEIGHICLETDGPLCGCGSHGCLEQFASATAIVRLAKEKLATGAPSSLNELAVFTSTDVFEASEKGDPLSMEVFYSVGYYLGIALAGLINVLNPEVIVITGGVSAGWNAFIGPTQEQVTKRAFQQPAERVKIVRGQLGDDAGILGAAKTAIAHAGKGSS